MHFLSVISWQVLMFFREQPISMTKSPLSWWRLIEVKFLTVTSLAKSLSYIPATYTPFECLF